MSKFLILGPGSQVPHWLREALACDTLSLDAAGDGTAAVLVVDESRRDLLQTLQIGGRPTDDLPSIMVTQVDCSSSSGANDSWFGQLDLLDSTPLHRAPRPAPRRAAASSRHGVQFDPGVLTVEYEF